VILFCFGKFHILHSPSNLIMIKTCLIMIWRGTWIRSDGSHVSISWHKIWFTNKCFL